MRRDGWGYLFVLPWVLLYLAFGIYPLLLSFYLTFFNYSFTNPGALEFVGVGNWIRGLLDPLVLAQPVQHYLQPGYLHRAQERAGPGRCPAAQASRQRRPGLPHDLLHARRYLGRRAYDHRPVPGQPWRADPGICLHTNIFWQSTIWLPMPVIAFINTWKWFGISTVIFLAGLLAIDQQLYEAASLDGAGAWDTFVSITLPQLRPQIFFLLVVDLIYGLQMFTEVFTLYDLGGGAYHQALTPVLYLYGQAFGESNIGYASALGLLLALDHRHPDDPAVQVLPQRELGRGG